MREAYARLPPTTGDPFSSPARRGRVLVRVYDLDDGTVVRIRDVGHGWLEPGDRVRRGDGGFRLAKRDGIGTFCGLFWVRP